MIHDEEYEKHYSPDGEHIEYLMENPQPTQPQEEKPIVIWGEPLRESQPQQEEWEKDLQGELRCYRSCCELDKMRERGESEDRIFLIIKHTISEIRKEEYQRRRKEKGMTAKAGDEMCEIRLRKREAEIRKEERERIIKRIEIFKYEKCDEFTNPLLAELIKKL
jgi:hypothetical protein